MSFAFVCAREDLQYLDDEPHETTGVMRRCDRCTTWAVAGYQCVTCEHEDVDPADQLSGHGPGMCEPPGDKACTGMTASWCPVHGDCACERPKNGLGGDLSDPGCPLHKPASTHGIAYDRGEHGIERPV